MNKDRIIEILMEVHPEVDYETENGLIDKRIFDSFDVVTVVGELMDEFDIEITAEHMIPENFNSAEAIAELVEQLEDE
ncbi:MAG: acyl carrier protein [Lachnospiraceae bacterium]|nr:acyl carrier protein [Lachnospiraceae bacterium]